MKTQLTALFILTTLAGGALAADATPATPAPRGPQFFQAADADKDGKLSASEFEALQAQHAARRAEREAATPTFEQLDTQGRGFVTQEQLRQARQAQRAADDKQDGWGKGHRREGRGGCHEGRGRDDGGRSLFGQADQDANGQLTQAEYGQLLKLQAARRAEHEAKRPDFATLDKNGDGFVTPAELRAAHRALRDAE